MRTESVKCPGRAVFAKSRARHAHIMSLNILTSHKSPLIYLFDKPGLLCSLAELLHYFVLPSENQNAFARSADFEFELILYSRIETARNLVRSDFLQRSIVKK